MKIEEHTNASKRAYAVPGAPTHSDVMVLHQDIVLLALRYYAPALRYYATALRYYTHKSPLQSLGVSGGTRGRCLSLHILR
jgi:hypothetical protein